MMNDRAGTAVRLHMENKPPLGIKPRHIHDQQRLSDIFDAILRYMTEGVPVPLDWLHEANDILCRYKDNSRQEESK